MENVTIHKGLPSGFARANELQLAEYLETGYVQGARKVCLIEGREAAELAVRLGPPRFLKSIRSNLGQSDVDSAEEYVEQYNKGWRAASRADSYPDMGWAMEDGYLDRAAGRAKWHLTFCSDHDNCGEG